MDMPDKYTQIDQRSRHDMDHANNRTHDNVKTCIFISYASEDREFANRLSSDLQTRGYTCWLDQWQVDVGECVLSKMDQGLRQSRYFVFILSKNSVKSSWVDVEWKTAYWQEIEAQSTIVLPVLKSNCDVPTFLRSRKYADFRESYQSGLAELCAALEKHDLDHALHKRKVWYWDDKPDALASFVKRHKDIFDIKCFNDVVEFLDSIRHIKPTSPEFPDVALVDLYALRSSTSIDKGEIEEACKKMELLLQLERNLKDYVDDAWESSGVEVVRWVRESYSFEELPISLYTQRGLVLLEDDLIMELEMFGTSWLLKNQFSPETERIMLNRQMQYGINAAIPGSKNLLLIDDNANFCKEFKARHASSYYIMSVRDQSQVLPTIIKMKQEGRFPHLLLVDLYYPKETGVAAEKKIDIANKKLKEYQVFEAEVRALVAKTHEPVGIRLLKEIRQILSPSQLPLLAFSRFGLLLLDEANIRRVEHLGAGWLLKDRYSSKTEQTKIMGQIFLEQMHSQQVRKPFSTDKQL